jgi:hypothetical protein
MIIQNRYADKKLVCKGKTFAHRHMRICVSVYFLKKSQPKYGTFKSGIQNEEKNFIGKKMISCISASDTSRVVSLVY